ncbi:carboxylesterase family protein [Catenulispora sp. NF23]|uniref:Carboxylic ester hydrolase n=1 Tax=Catenulispora pinistramenti TaxID=2705254 RepID=A0ABS5KXU1_9ACTN|nr:carboxylesterase family protein [Catenulispora pinistramenti]MBS2534481.1 carboxylesterase family protein [Catenulispora pinistramenti]MBS2550881.1 carboxylesterase family protein [Catenulispora pinistramenti]
MNMLNRPIADTESGSVQGVLEDGIAAFRGIPYAASPAGDLRFAAPQPHPKWTELRDASRSGPAVPQSASRLEAVMGRRTPDWDEDGSLTLNIWTPQHADKASEARPRPVLIWFHGGGFSSGSGGWDWYDGRSLADAGDIVVVTANYRIGPLGYMYLPELGVANLGTQDQGAVLDWVARNIAGFGGDPEQVTVGGQSAGAFSSLYLAASPTTGPLVKRVIVQSNPFGLAPQDPDAAAEHARRFVDILGLTGSLDLLGALRAVPAERLLSAYGQLAGELSRPGDVAPPMYPVLGGPGMPAVWEQAVADGGFDGKQILTGTTKNEMTAFFGFDPRISALSDEQARAIVDGQVADGAERYDRIAARSSSHSNSDGNDPSHGAAPRDVLTELVTEIVFRDGTLAIADHQAAAGFDTYVYEFDYTPGDDPAHLGSTHCAELPFFFNTIDAYPDCAMLGRPTTATRELAAKFSHAAAAFVATGRPADDDWRRYESGDSSTVRHLL